VLEAMAGHHLFSSHVEYVGCLGDITIFQHSPCHTMFNGPIYRLEEREDLFGVQNQCFDKTFKVDKTLTGQSCLRMIQEPHHDVSFRGTEFRSSKRCSISIGTLRNKFFYSLILRDQNVTAFTKPIIMFCQSDRVVFMSAGKSDRLFVVNCIGTK
jgi:hypothetical protein